MLSAIAAGGEACAPVADGATIGVSVSSTTMPGPSGPTLLPAVAMPGMSGPGHGSSSNGAVKASRINTKNSCVSCRFAKKACSGERPCKRCVVRELPNCVDYQQSTNRGRRRLTDIKRERDVDRSRASSAYIKSESLTSLPEMTGFEVDSSLFSSMMFDTNFFDGADQADSANGVPRMMFFQFEDVLGAEASSDPIVEQSELKNKHILVFRNTSGCRDYLPVLCADPDWLTRVGKNDSRVARLHTLLECVRTEAARIGRAGVVSVKAMAPEFIAQMRECLSVWNEVYPTAFIKTRVRQYVPGGGLDRCGNPWPCVVWDSRARIEDANAMFCTMSGSNTPSLWAPREWPLGCSSLTTRIRWPCSTWWP
eukprot:Opistho-1_new@62563